MKFLLFFVSLLLGLQTIKAQTETKLPTKQVFGWSFKESLNIDSAIDNQLHQPDTCRFAIEYEQSTSTSLEVHLIGLKGIKYNVKEILTITDTINEKILLDSITSSTPIKFEEEIVNIILNNFSPITLEKIQLKKNHCTKIYYFTNLGKLIFSYFKNQNIPIDRIAEVCSNDVPSSIIICKDTNYFPPGEYLISVNILPEYKIITEIHNNVITEIQMPVPGAIELLNVDKFIIEEMYYQRGNTYQPFYTTKSIGDLQNSLLILRPGMYKLKYRNKNYPYSAPYKTLEFYISPNKIARIDMSKVLYNSKISSNPNALPLFTTNNKLTN